MNLLRKISPVVILSALTINFSCTPNIPPVLENPAENSEPDTLIWVLTDPALEQESDTVAPALEDTVFLENETGWNGLTSSELLDSTAKLLDAALTLQEEGDMIVSQYYYTQVRNLIDEVDAHDPEIDSLLYHRVVDGIKHFHSDYVVQMDVLPEEMSPEAVLAGVEIAEGDTLNGENGLFEKPVIEIDSRTLDELSFLREQLPPVPIDLDNVKVQNAIKFFQGKGRKVFSKWLERAEYAVAPMQKILREEGIPEEIVYLSMIESGFNPKAYSYAHASGPWQFIRSTGKIFGLEANWWYDERRDVDKSTRAATKYLRKLYLEFEDWNLALAAYNCGEGRVRRHIRRYGTKDFWKLRKLPKQTRNYVPTYLAATAIALNPTEYGFNEYVLKNPPPYDSVLVKECIDLKAIAGIVGSEYQKIKDLNPAIIRWCTPPNDDSTWVRIPLGTHEQFLAGIDKIPADQKRSWVRHKVKRGETLSTIARKYGTSMKAIIDVKSNNIRSRHKIREKQTILIPVPPYKYKSEWAASEPEELYFPPEAGDKTVYKVRQGDNLSTIAAKFGTSVSKLKRWNNLWGKRFIYPGQKLVIWRKSSADYAAAPSKKTTVKVEKYDGAPPRVHRVKSGESLWLIAQKYGISLNELKRMNGLAGRCVIKPGDELVLGGSEGEYAEIQTPRVHKVRRGDTLWDIAVAYGVRLTDLKRENGLSGNSIIRPGDKLTIPN
ncbi:MAG: LysM peptidoglycan-binding domain-containing protein [FCB group bacterium]|nr:LysM peptidoglycan-binding domain-containing protein [FCB group bacterium]